MDLSKFQAKLTQLYSSVSTQIPDKYKSDSIATGYTLGVLVIFMLLSRFQTVSRDIIDLRPTEPEFISISAYTVYRNVLFAVNNNLVPILSDPLGNFPTGGSVSHTGVLESVIAVFVLPVQLFVSTEIATAIVIYAIGPVAAVITLACVYISAKELFTPYVALLAAGIYALLPGRFAGITTYGSGSIQALELLFLSIFITSLIILVTEATDKIVLQQSIFSDLRANRTLLVSFISTIISFTLLATHSLYTFAFVYTVLIAVIVLHTYADTRHKSGQLEPVLTVFIPLLLVGSIFVSFVTVLTSIYTGFTVCVSISILLVAVARLYVEDTVLSDYAISENQYNHLVFGIPSVVLLGLGGTVFSESFEWISVVANTSSSAGYLFGLQPLVTTNVQDVIFTNFGVMPILAVIGFVVFISKTLLLSLRKYPNVHAPIGLSIGIVLSISALYSTEYFTFVSFGVSLFGAYAIYKLLDFSDVFQLNSVGQLKAYHIIIVVIAVGSLIPAFVVPIDGTAVSEAQSQTVATPDWADAAQELNESTVMSADPYSHTTEPEYGVIAWGNYGSSAIRGIGERPSSGLTDTSTQLSSRYLLSQDEENALDLDSETDSDVRYIALDYQMIHPYYQFNWIAELHPSNSPSDYYTTVYDTNTNRPAFEVFNDKYYESLGPQLYLFHGSAVDRQPVVVSYTSQSVSQGGNQQLINTTFISLDRPQEQHIQRFESIQEAESYVEEQRTSNLDTSQDSNENSSGTTTPTPTTPTPESENADSPGDEIFGGDGGSDSNTSTGTHQIGGIGTNPTTSVDALEHHRFVTSSEASALDNPVFGATVQRTSQYAEDLRYSDVLRDESSVKIFEQVEGAVINGTGPANAEVQISVTLQNENAESAFNYVQTVQTNENGEFSATVPYSSQGTPESYTVHSVTSYQLVSISRDITQTDGEVSLNTQISYAELDVTEESVMNGESQSVELEQVSQQEFQEIVDQRRSEIRSQVDTDQTESTDGNNNSTESGSTETPDAE